MNSLNYKSKKVLLTEVKPPSLLPEYTCSYLCQRYEKKPVILTCANLHWHNSTSGLGARARAKVGLVTIEAIRGNYRGDYRGY